MDFEKPSQAAKRLGVTPRAIQKWAMEGRIPCAHKVAGQWMIPTNFTEPADKKAAAKTDASFSSQFEPKTLLNSEFRPGECLAYIDSIEDEDERNMVFAEYCHYSGNSEEAIKISEKYLDCDNAHLRNTACLLYMFANMGLGHLHLAKYAISVLNERVARQTQNIVLPEIHSLLVWTSYVAALVFNTDVDGLEPLEDWIKYLPEGLKLFACYMLASKMRQSGKYQGAHSVARIAVQLSDNKFILPRIFCKLMDAIALMDMKLTEDAEKQFMLAWELAIKDGFIEPFTEHYSLLSGLAERCIKKDYPEEYKKITEKARIFYGRIRAINDMDSDGEMLTVTEFSIAMLYARDWSAKEIAEHFNISVRTVYRHISNIYATLNIGSVAELKKYVSD